MPGARPRARTYQQTIEELHHKLGRLPHDEEIADALDLDVDDLSNLERDAHLASQISLETPIGEEGTLGNTLGQDLPGPEHLIEKADQRQVLLEALGDLKEQERIILKLYYFEGMLMKEIAATLGVTESHICQIHRRLMGVLRGRLLRAGLELH